MDAASILANMNQLSRSPAASDEIESNASCGAASSGPEITSSSVKVAPLPFVDTVAKQQQIKMEEDKENIVEQPEEVCKSFVPLSLFY